MSIIDRANQIIRPLVRRYIHYGYARKLRHLKKRNTQLFRPRDSEAERVHVRLWSPLKLAVPVGWYRFFANLSEMDDPRYVPDNIYHAILERVLNDLNYAWVFADKNYYQRHYPPALFPRSYLRNVSGTWLDGEYNTISEGQANALFQQLPDAIVVKPSIDSCSGSNVRMFRRTRNQWYCGTAKMEWVDICGLYGENWLVQEHIKQHADIAKINPSSVNTLRVFTYRSVTNNTVSATTIIRMRCSGAFVDNANAGGILAAVGSNGRVSPVAATADGYVMRHHPDSKQEIGEIRVPNIGNVLDTCREVALQAHALRVLSFDVCIRDNGKPCIIEVNTWGQSAHLSQFCNPPLFGKFTDEVIEYAANSMNRDRFKVLRLQG